jgi:ribosomal protein S27AE
MPQRAPGQFPWCGEVKMAVWNFKGCPRCGGDTFLDQDHEGIYEHCLLCGYSKEIPVTALRPRKPAVPEKSGN